MVKLDKPGVKDISAYIIADIICVGAGMGVPFFCILLGFPAGWYIAKRITSSSDSTYQRYNKILTCSLLASGFTFLMMLIVWTGAILINIHSSSDIENFGHPNFLFDPTASFVGWLILMIIISPFLQLLTIIFSAFVTLLRIEKKNKDLVSTRQSL